MGYVGPQSGPTPPPVATPESPRLIFGIFPGMTGTEGVSTASAAMTYDLACTEEAPTRP